MNPLRRCLVWRYGIAMRVFGFLLTIASSCPTDAIRADDPLPVSDARFIKQLQGLYAKDAAEFAIYRDREHKEKLELHVEPVYLWTNVIRHQHGSVFVWTWKGRPEVIGSMFSFPAQIQGKRGIMHEFHSLSTATLQPERKSENQWKPQAGLQRKLIPDAPKPVDLARQRLFQMREFSRDFTARSIDREERTWELRLLTQPLFRYQSTDPNVLDGAIFAYVTSAGTDPEVVLLIEALRNDDGPSWNYAVCRFSDLNLYVSYKEQEVWTSVSGGENTIEHDPQHLYRLYRDRRIDEIVPNAKPE